MKHKMIEGGYPIVDYTPQEWFSFVNDTKLMAQYEKVLPGITKRFMVMYQKEVEHFKKINK